MFSSFNQDLIICMVESLAEFSRRREAAPGSSSMDVVQPLRGSRMASTFPIGYAELTKGRRACRGNFRELRELKAIRIGELESQDPENRGCFSTPTHPTKIAGKFRSVISYKKSP